jgi:hypothetical protein
MAEERNAILTKIVNDLGELVAAKSKAAVHDAEKVVEADLVKVCDQLKLQLQRCSSAQRRNTERT